MKRLLLIIFLLPAMGWAATYDSDGSQSDVQTKVNTATDGDTVTIPGGGSFSWSTAVTIANKAITLRSSDTNDPPTITYTGASGAAIAVSTITNKIAKVAHLVMTNTTTASQLISISGVGSVFWLDDIRWNISGSSTWAVWTAGPNNGINGIGPFGLISRCKLVTEAGPKAGFFIRQNTGTDPWTTDTEWGTTNAVVIEDCVFSCVSVSTGIPPSDGDSGGITVFRYNAVTNYALANHGPDTPGPTRSHLQWEVYKNTFHYTDLISHSMLSRGGTGLIFSNLVGRSGSGELSTIVSLKIYCGEAANCSLCAQCLTNYPADYPISQQIGRGVSGGVEASLPVYLWDNIFTNSNFAPIGGTTDFVIEGRDWTNNTALPGYVPLAYPHPLRAAAAEGGGSFNPIRSSGKFKGRGRRGL